jgi:hypothetical protein
MTKELMEGIVVKPGRSIPDAVIGSAFVSIGQYWSHIGNAYEADCDRARGFILGQH